MKIQVKKDKILCFGKLYYLYFNLIKSIRHLKLRFPIMKNVSSPEASVINQPTKGYRKYHIKGVDHEIVARKGGPTANQIKFEDNYAEVRKHQKEFGVASMMAKALRSSLSECMSEICETYVSGRLTAKFRNLAKLEEGTTGTRPMVLSRHGHLLNGFEFNTRSPYKEIFGAKYFVKQGSVKGEVILHFPAFTPVKAFEAPEGTTNFKIVSRLVAISDFSYDSVEGSYKPSNEELHGAYGSFESPMLPLLKIPTEPMTGKVSLPNLKNVPAYMGLFLLMAVSFYKYENGNFQHLSKNSGMQIHQVY